VSRRNAYNTAEDIDALLEALRDNRELLV